MEAIEDPVVRTPDHAKLLDYGLDQKVADRLDQIFQVISCYLNSENALVQANRT